MDKGKVIVEEIKKVLSNDQLLTEMTLDKFRFADTDQSGEVSIDEFYAAYAVFLKNLKLPDPTKEDAQKVFQELDVDNSGILDRNEYKPFVRKMLELMVYRIENNLLDPNDLN
jgi:Ca2+-binding EF-hand superfamily protein